MFETTKERLKQEYDKSCEDKDNKYKKIFETYSDSKESVGELEEKACRQKWTIEMHQNANKALRKEVKYRK